MELQNSEIASPFDVQLMTLFDEGKIKEAHELTEKTLDEIRMRLGSNDKVEIELALALEVQSDFHRALNDHTKAESGYLEAIHFLDRNEGYEEDSARIHASMAVLHDFGGDPNDAKEYYVKAIERYEDLEDPANLDVADFCNNLAYIYEANENFSQAEASFKKALTLTQSELGMDHDVTALRYNNLGTFYFKQDQQEKAKELHLTALNVRRRLFGSDHVETAESSHNYALVMIRQGRVDEGLKYFERSIGAFEKYLDIAREDYETVAANYRDVLESLEDQSALEALDQRVESALQALDEQLEAAL